MDLVSCMVVWRSALSDSILITNDIKESSFSAIRFCSLIGGIGNRTDLTVSDFKFFTVDPAANSERV